MPGTYGISTRIGGKNMAEHFQGTVESLFKGMDNFVTTKTCVGEPIYVGDTIILPLLDVSFGMMASTKNEERRSNGGGGMGGKMTPTALLVIKDGATRLVNIRNQGDSTLNGLKLYYFVVMGFITMSVKQRSRAS